MLLLLDPADTSPYAILQGRLDELECRRKLLKGNNIPMALMVKEIRKLEIDLLKIDGLIEILEYILVLESSLSDPWI